MVTNHHEIAHTLFEDDPGLMSRALRHAGLDFPDFGHVEQLGTDLSTVQAVERRADRVIRFRAKDGREGILVLEVQRDKKVEKPATWGFYGMTLVNRYKLPVVIVVVTTTVRCELWAAQGFDFGMGFGDRLTVKPLVLGPSTVKPILDAEQARADPVFAVLSVVVHRDRRNIGAILRAVAEAIEQTPAPDGIVLADYIELVLGNDPSGKLWRELMALHPDVFQGPTMRGIIDKATAQGLAEGKADFLLTAIKMRGIEIAQEQSARVKACADEQQLELWLSRVFDAANAADIFAD